MSGYAETRANAEAFAAKCNAETPRSAELSPARVDLYGADMWQVSMYTVHADGGRSFNHFAYIEDVQPEPTGEELAQFESLLPQFPEHEQRIMRHDIAQGDATVRGTVEAMREILADRAPDVGLKATTVPDGTPSAIDVNAPKPVSLLLEFTPEVNSACDHSTAYVGGRPVATLQRKRSSDRSRGPVWTIHDTAGRQVATVSVGQRWGELMAMERTFKHARGLLYVAQLEQEHGASLDYDARAAFKAMQAHVMAHRAANPDEPTPRAITSMADGGQTLDVAALASGLESVGLSAIVIDENTVFPAMTLDSMSEETAEPEFDAKAFSVMGYAVSGRNVFAAYSPSLDAAQGDLAAYRSHPERADVARWAIRNNSTGVTVHDSMSESEAERLAYLHLVNVCASLEWHMQKHGAAGMDQHRLDSARAFMAERKARLGL